MANSYTGGVAFFDTAGVLTGPFLVQAVVFRNTTAAAVDLKLETRKTGGSSGDDKFFLEVTVPADDTIVVPLAALFPADQLDASGDLSANATIQAIIK